MEYRLHVYEYTMEEDPKPPEIGAFMDCPAYHTPGKCPAKWTNCDGHILVRFPPGVWFDIVSRASNCTLKEDGEHRCWVVHGELPGVTVDKNGRTCSAGGGSFMIGDWHGFIRDGAITQ